MLAATKMFIELTWLEAGGVIAGAIVAARVALGVGSLFGRAWQEARTPQANQ